MQPFNAGQQHRRAFGRPGPILDGGQVLYQLAEWLKGSPLSERAQAVGQQIGIALLVLLMGVAFFNDIVRQIQPG